jgi:hypothetical protein
MLTTSGGGKGKGGKGMSPFQNRTGSNIMNKQFKNARKSSSKLDVASAHAI